ncbi:MAG: EamA family transporter [Proteobacteria bacterium]|nr:EamA family transporter [Pseudomonadota bacterium]
MNSLATSPRPAGSEWQPHILLSLAMLFLAIAVIFGRVFHADVPPVGMAFWRAVAAFVVLLPLSIASSSPIYRSS